ncbi:antibiotic biosynthesis monooxygenase family protein [Leifsonia shinshuensis]
MTDITTQTTTFATGDGRFYMVNFLTVERESQLALAENMAEAGAKAIRNRPGCVSVNVLKSTDGYRVLYIAQWESKEAIKASLGDPLIQSYRDRASELGTPDAHAFTVFSTHYPDAAGDPDSAAQRRADD